MARGGHWRPPFTLWLAALFQAIACAFHFLHQPSKPEPPKLNYRTNKPLGGNRLLSRDNPFLTRQGSRIVDDWCHLVIVLREIFDSL